MAIKFESLPKRLQKNLAPVWLLAGDEPMQKIEATDLIRTAAEKQGYTERIVLNVMDSGFNWAQLTRLAVNVSMFSSQRIIELRSDEKKLTKESGTAIVNYLSHCSTEDVLIVSSGKLDKATRRTKWFTELQQVLDDCAGVCVDIWPVAAARLPQWLQDRLAAQGKHISEVAARFVADCVEGNLLMARQEVDKLVLLSDAETLRDEQVRDVLMDSARFNVFMLFENACAGNIVRVFRILGSLRNEGVELMAVYGVLMWELRRLCDFAERINNGESEQQVFRRLNVFARAQQLAMKQVAEKQSVAVLQKQLRQAIHLERMIKDSRSNVLTLWDEIGFCLARVAGFALS